jgi:branched-chain amino acid transport system ATP-binding protein
VLEVSGLQAGYGKVQVLWGVDLRVAEGEFVALIGANGAGKTTLLRTISGLIRPLAGTVRYRGHPLHDRRPVEIVALGIAHVPEGRELFPMMTVLDNLELGAWARPEARARVRESLEDAYRLFPRLADRRYQPAGTLSGGEQQMLAIARALMSRPTCLLVDEPSLGLSPRLVQTVFAALYEINRAGVSILLVEQNVRQSLRLAHRAYVMENGRIVLQGAGADLLDSPHVREAYLRL